MRTPISDGGSAASASTRAMPSSMPSSGARGVVRTFAEWRRPPCSSTTSVNVPPMSAARRAGVLWRFTGEIPMLTRSLGTLALGSLAALAFVISAQAQDLPKAHFKVIGLNSPTVVSFLDEVPFWRDTLPKVSKGALTADITPLDQMGIADATMLRLLRLGVMDFAAMDISKMAGDDPRFEGCDLAGITLDPDKARAGCEAYRKVIDRQMQKNWNAKFLAFGGNPPHVFWCRGNLNGRADLKGKKVRVFNVTMRDFLAGVGATAISMPFAEVVPALSAGVVDCGVTGSLSGNTAGGPEVAKFLYPMALGWSINGLAANLHPCNPRRNGP